jgi:hypothetical protein
VRAAVFQEMKNAVDDCDALDTSQVMISHHAIDGVLSLPVHLNGRFFISHKTLSSM